MLKGIFFIGSENRLWEEALTNSLPNAENLQLPSFFFVSVNSPYAITAASIIAAVNETLSPELTASDTIIVTDINAGCQAAAFLSIPAVGIVPSIESSMYGAALITDDANTLTLLLLTKVWHRYHHIPLTIGKTKRLFIRELSVSDIPALFDLYQNPSVTRYIEKMDDLAAETDKITAYITTVYPFYDYGQWGIFCTKSNRLLGKIGIEQKSYPGLSSPFYEVSYMLGFPFWHKGYAAESLEFIIQYAKKELCLPSLTAIIDVQNTPSLKLAKKTGFIPKTPLMVQGRSCMAYEYCLKENPHQAAAKRAAAYYQQDKERIVYSRRYKKQ